MIALIYNVILAVHLYKEKVSNILHDEYIMKKEVEYCVGISEMWNSRYFYTFSSFKPEIAKMYHRVLFNVMSMLLVVVHALLP